MLSSAQIRSYGENGYLFLEEHFSRDEMDALRGKIDEVGERQAAYTGMSYDGGWGGKWRENLLPDGEAGRKTALLSIHNMPFHSAYFTRLLLDEKVTEVMAGLIGPNIQLHHVKMHAKPPREGTAFPMHQDYHYFPHEQHSMCAYVIFVDDATIENGCLCLYPGSHTQVLPPASDGLYLPPSDYPLEKAMPCPGPAGSVLIFNYRTIHGSFPNTTDATRRILLLQLRSPDDNPTEELHQSPGLGLMLRGENPRPILTATSG